MPHIEELPLTAGKAAAPGWSYVPDTGYDPSKAPLNPTTARSKRKYAALVGGDRGDLSLRQQGQAQKLIAELDDDRSGRKIEVPTRKTAAEEKRGARHQTSNVARILKSEKTFVHYLDDEEALLDKQPARPSYNEETPKPAPRASKTPLARRKSTALTIDSSTSSSPVPAALPQTPMGPPPLPHHLPQPTPKPQSPTSAVQHPSPYTLPSDAELEALLSAPPLSYSAAQSAPPPRTDPPPRRFCDVCGYWGRIKCLSCGGRYCGLGCKEAHLQDKCLRWK
ncbi:hypothetical protein LTR66_001460 [Elasticomyces elasticus]|nr:hypothetical protein LTR28_009398 [Elasticomyces elasticus]KAK4999535.1 hypothetical protein LTR66_001460 [Elasticomyces elasticus]